MTYPAPAGGAGVDELPSSVFDRLRLCVSELQQTSVSESESPKALNELKELCEIVNDIEIEALVRVSAVADSGLSQMWGLTTKRYLAHELDIPDRDANAKIRTASFLRSCPLTAKAVMAGELSLAHGEVLAAAWKQHSDAYGDYESDFLDLVRVHRYPLDKFTTTVKKWRWRTDDMGRNDAERTYDERYLHLQPRLDGSGRGTFSCTAEQFEIIREALTTNPDPANGPDPQRSLGQRQIDTLVAMLGNESTRPDCLCGADGSEVQNDGDPHSADGCCCHSGSFGTKGPGSAIDVVVDLQTLAELSGGDPGMWKLTDLRSELRHSGTVPPALLEQWLCDPVLRAMIFDGPNVVLSYNRATALIPPALRRVVRTRDQHCVATGCRMHTDWCDVHHVVPRSQGGTTTEENLATLCRRHHTMIHLGQLFLAKDPATGAYRTTLP